MDPSQSAVSVSGVGKKYAKSLGQSLIYGLSDIGRELLLRGDTPQTLRRGEFWALKDVSFALKRGESLAIIGRNGSGKSTLLKLLYGLIKPDAGEITIRGRMAALIELGAGFDAILSGRENVYINASILGFSREAVDEVLPAIIEFSGLGDFMETPVKFYSSGMRARLAYSIATNLSPDIFLVDEVLSVGDAEFRQKCLRNMVKFIEQGGSLIFVSHTANQIQAVCNRGIVLDGGKICYDGTALAALDHYYRSGLHRAEKERARFESSESPDCRIEAVQIEPSPDTGAIRTGREFSLTIIAVLQREADVTASISILARDLLTVLATESSEPRLCPAGRHVFRFRIASLPLMPGLFHLRGSLREGERRLPLVTFGFQEAPRSFLVGGDPTPENVRAHASGQLIKIHGEWE